MNKQIIEIKTQLYNISNCEKQKNFSIYKEVFNKHISEPPTMVEKKYNYLFTNAIKTNDFTILVETLEKEFKDCYILWKLLEKIMYLNSILFSFEIKKINTFKLVENIFLYKQIFLAQLKYNTNIWLKLNTKQTQKVKNSNEINYKILLFILDFKKIDFSDEFLKEWQKDLLNLILISNNFDDFVKFIYKNKINVFDYLPLKSYLGQIQYIKKNKFLFNNSKHYMAYIAFMQMFCLFIEENLTVKN